MPYDRLNENNLFFWVRDWLFEAGRYEEDDTQLLGSSFSVIAEDGDGYRWIHNHSFMSGKIEQDDLDGFSHWVQNLEGDNARAEALIAKIEDHIKAGGKLNPRHWTPIQGCYGSAGWDEQTECELEQEEESRGW